MFPLQGGSGSIPGWGTKILHATQHGQKNKNFKKDFKKEGNFQDKSTEEAALGFRHRVGKWTEARCIDSLVSAGNAQAFRTTGEQRVTQV